MPDYAAVRKHLVAEGTVGKAELKKLIEDVIAVFSMHLNYSVNNVLF